MIINIIIIIINSVSKKIIIIIPHIIYIYIYHLHPSPPYPLSLFYAKGSVSALVRSHTPLFLLWLETMPLFFTNHPTFFSFLHFLLIPSFFLLSLSYFHFLPFPLYFALPSSIFLSFFFFRYPLFNFIFSPLFPLPSFFISSPFLSTLTFPFRSFS